MATANLNENSPLINVAGVIARDNEQRLSCRTPAGKGVLCVLLVVFFERLAYYSITINLVSFSDKLFKDIGVQGLTVNLLFQGTAFFLPLVAGIIADTLLGKKKILASFFPIYILGSLLFTISGVSGVVQEAKVILFVAGLSLCTVGAAGVRACLTPYGADQIETKDSQRSFFHWSYFVINVSSLIAVTGINYIELEEGYWSGYVVAPCSLLCALVFFHVGNRWCRETEQPSYLLFVAVKHLTGQAKRGNTHQLPERNRLAVDPNDAKAFANVLVCISTLLGFSVVYSAYQTVYTLQGEHMNATVIGGKEITSSSLSAFDNAIILLIIPIVDRVVWPCLMSRGIRVSYLHRIGFGILCGILSVLAALLVEHYRHTGLSIMAQVPQYVLMGLGEILAFIPCYEMAYIESPAFTKSTTMGLVWTTSGIGFYISAFVINLVEERQNWFPMNDEDPKLSYPFLILEGVVVVFFILYLIVACTRKPKNGDNRGNGRHEIV
ncbi:solute carrier family 15 member 4 [Lingula anatina]|uniref:Solute carrier family 15 member 4 n=1 Tax=Lingula anatina TaxID=7574 RepID=A0A1S3IHD4_LINAN|nr:solute carrier family 15 member 4 [Lingula anatina]|eukprot:XP_013397670.1 solute carrier family 15 member 4 [Lingula anatina]